MLDDLNIRNKLVLLVAGPIIIVVLLSAIGARSRQASASTSGRVEKLVAVAQADSDVVDALQQEAVYSAAFVGSDHKSWTKEVATARKNTDIVMATAIGRLNGESGGGAAGYSSARTLALDSADKLSYVRKTVDQGYRWDQAVSVYAATEENFLSVNSAIADSLSDPQAGSQLRTAAALASYKASIATEGAVLAGAGEAGGFEVAAATKLLRKAVDDQDSQGKILTSIAGSATKGSVRDALATDAHLALGPVEKTGLAADVGGPLAIDGKTVVANTSTVIKDLHAVEADLFRQLIADSQRANSNAQRAAKLFLVAALVAVLGAAAAAVLLGRRITRPLNRLTIAADHLSKEQMPRLIQTLKNPSEEELGFQIGAMRDIEVEGNDEIGRLAKSFNDVQRVASEVATEQAALLRKGIGEMFVNLARRNQALLDRQIEFIDELERGEEDPDQLDNLYRLDHLATRMRRNAESLLVLAGAEPPRRRGRPAPLANVVRAALAEVEDFGRIELLSLDEVLVASNAAADLAHLLSELMENATNFSPPETRVEVVGHKTKADGYVISVTDHGIGMSADQIADANESLAKPPLVGLAMTRSLGFIVVGRLAARHGIAVRIMPSASGGVTAVVSLAPSLVVDTPGGVADEPTVTPARLKPVLDHPTGGSQFAGGDSPTEVPPLEFTPFEEEPFVEEAPLEPVAWESPAPTASGLPSRGTNANGSGVSQIGAANAPMPDTSPLEQPIAWDQAPNVVGPPAVVEPPEPVAELPDAISFDDGAPATASPAPGPSAPSAPSASGAATDFAAPAAAPSANRPFFLEDAEPPRPFPIPGERAATPRQAPAAPAPAAVAPAPPRLFGGPPASEAPVAPLAPVAPVATPTAPSPSARISPPPAPAPKAPMPLVPRRAAAPPVPIPGATPPAAPAAAAPAPGADPSLPTRTTSGLAKRVPREAGGVRNIPGSGGERGVGATKRSPEEIRQMLSRHSQGRQRARTEEPVTTGAPDERQPNE